MKMSKFRIIILLSLISVLLVGCGSKEISESEWDEYVNGIKIVNLLDASSYEQDGDNMVNALEKVINAEPNDYQMLKQNTKFFSKETSFEETFSNSEKDFYYIGDMKDGKPHGWGVILSDIGDYMQIHYVGNFKKGTVEDCYGMTMNIEYYNGGAEALVAIGYEGIMSYLTFEDLIAYPADGERVRTYRFEDVKDNTVSYESMGVDQFNVVKCVPKYVGEMKDGEYDGEGILYYSNGTIKYEGEFKNGVYSGKGKLYSESGELVKEGKFKNGELKEGEYYRENDN